MPSLIRISVSPRRRDSRSTVSRVLPTQTPGGGPAVPIFSATFPRISTLAAAPSLVDLRALRDLRAFAEDWLVPAQAALSEGRLKSLQLDLEDGTCYRLSRGQRWRFWRRPRDTLAQ